MAKFLVLYRAPVSALEQMANVTPEQAQAGMELWGAWADRAGLAGYSILEAASRDAVMELLHEHPHLHTPGGQVEVHETLPVPGS